jgi:murein DD-endopeptidase MepM/ murein hydrolase activator NlpD
MMQSMLNRRANPTKPELPTQPIQSPAAPTASDRVELAPLSFNSVFARTFAKVAVWFGEAAWLSTGDQAKKTALRLVSHAVILVVVIGTAILAGGVRLQPALAAAIPDQATKQPADQENFIGEGGPVFFDQLTVAPLANPFTVVPNRPRKDIIIYTVQPNDILSQIAVLYSLKVETILWANTDVLHDDPHNLTPGMSLKIPPVDGIIHTVISGDTVDSLATKYKTTADAIYIDGAAWNNLKPGQQPLVGATLIVPGGSRDFQVASLTARVYYTGQADSGFCPSTGAVGSGTFIWPIAQHWTSGYRYAPWHPGIDLAAHTGDQVYAVDSGTVIYAGWNNSGYGNLIVIDHGNGWSSYYAHNSVIVVACGQVVAQGQLISAAGSTGRSSGPHLHFETHFNGVPQNPFNVLPAP